MARLLFIYPLRSENLPSFRYAETAKRLYNEKVDVQLLTVGKAQAMPAVVKGIPHHHISSTAKGLGSLFSLDLQVKLWNYLLAIPKDGLSIFMDGLDFPIVFWACRKLNLPLIAQFPTGKCYSTFHKGIIHQFGRSEKTTLLYGSQVHASNCHITGFNQHIISMPLSKNYLKAAQLHRDLIVPEEGNTFTVLIGCRTASPATLKKINTIANRCKQIHFHCWFFNQGDYPTGVVALRHKENVTCHYIENGIPLYRTAKIYVEVEESTTTAPALQLDYIRQAMEFGLPALLFRDGLGEEWIKPGVNGYILGAGQVGEMADKIKLLAHSSLLHNRLSYNASKIAQQWHPPNVCRALSDLLLASKLKCTYRTGLREAENLIT